MEFPDHIEADVVGSVSVDGLDNELSNIASICSSFDDFIIVGVCLASCAMGWKRAVPGLILYVIADIWQGKGTTNTISDRLLYVLTLVAAASLVRWIFLKFKSVRKAPVEA